MRIAYQATTVSKPHPWEKAHLPPFQNQLFRGASLDRFLPRRPTPLTSMTAYVVSDVHLNNHPYDRTRYTENPRRQHFRQFLTDLNVRHNESSQKTVLILNGDIIDMTGSWMKTLKPWDSHPEALTAATEVLNEILENNRPVFDELKRFLSFQNTEIRYVIGNHDNMFMLFPELQEQLKAVIAPQPEQAQRLHFTQTLELPEIGLYAEHGHALDPFNRSTVKKPFPVGDYVNIMLINRFVERVSQRLESHQYSPDVIDHLKQRLHQIEYLRPITLIPVWIEATAHEYRHHPENPGKQESIDDVIMGVFEETLNARKNPELAKRLNIDMFPLNRLTQAAFQMPGSFSLFSRIYSMATSHANAVQIKHAEKIHQEKGFRFITMGHTHRAELYPLRSNTFYFNTGGWKPVINLYTPPRKKASQWMAPLQFNQVENSVVVEIEKDLTRPEASPTFKMKTLQSNKP